MLGTHQKKRVVIVVSLIPGVHGPCCKTSEDWDSPSPTIPLSSSPTFFSPPSSLQMWLILFTAALSPRCHLARIGTSSPHFVEPKLWSWKIDFCCVSSHSVGSVIYSHLGITLTPLCFNLWHTHKVLFIMLILAKLLIYISTLDEITDLNPFGRLLASKSARLSLKLHFP